MSTHSNPVTVHRPYNWSYADAAARLAATGFIAEDDGKLARQLSPSALYMLTAYAGPTWELVSSPGGTAAADVTFDNATSGLTATDAQAAIDELAAAVDALGVLAQNSQSSAYTLVLSDAGKHIFHPGADTTARIWTIPANASVAFPIGSAVTFVNDTAGGVITIAITTDTLVLAGAGTTGSRTLAANGIATALKITSTRWQINGTGLT